ncbi:DUF3797 domain-containing protein [Lysinibacillus sphaericus]|uniref:DUF3797 domain-containing protein n=1 Tax=Lysinibacillus sphaericus TaxID=1421 RepID=UPI001910A5EF|nr:DUF3797 domain-containing protein [Lysinibacillus sphaericus]QPA56544.1 DUF3797 domain-containing protein [Lysinibacillus sphaericus]
MSLLKIFFYILRYKKCHSCGNRLVGNDEGCFELTEKGFKRNCKCGASIQTAFPINNKKF